MKTVTRKVEARPEHCMGCGLCRLACQVAHSPYPQNMIKAMKTGKKPVARMTVEVSSNGTEFRSVRCINCEDPECLKICISGAISRNEETGQVTTDENRCVGCWSCVIACPEGAVFGPLEGEARAHKCDLCPQLEIPACVAICPNEALMVVEIEGVKR